MSALSWVLEEIEEKLNTLTVTNEPNVTLNLPKCNLELTERAFSSTTHMAMASETSSPVQMPESNELCVVSSASSANIEEEKPQFIYATYSIDKMASDGKNILYSGQRDGDDIIAYINLQHNEDPDPWRQWNQSSILDMIWWHSIGKFVCATENGAYTIEYTDGRFKINAVIRERWSHARVAAHQKRLLIWNETEDEDFSGIDIYSSNFQHIRTIDFEDESAEGFTNNSTSFAVTKKHIASLRECMQNDQQVFQVNFCDWDMQRTNKVLLGKCTADTEIRANAKGDFFIATGLKKLHIISSDMNTRTISLKDRCGCLAIVDDHTIATCCNSKRIQLLYL